MPRVTITVPDRNSQPYRFQLDRQEVSLGRGPDNDIVIDSGSVSVRHAEMHRISGGYELRDAGSTNGIKLAGVRQPVVPLTNGADVRIGDVAFDFQLSDEELRVLGQEAPAGQPPIIAEADLPPAPEMPRHVPVTVVHTSGGGGGLVAAVLFLILAAAAFFAGLAVRYQKETGGSLIDAMRSKPAREAPAVPATPDPAPPAAE